MAGARTAHVVAGDSLTCLVLSRAPSRPYAGRGVGATLVPEGPATGMPLATCAVNVTSYLHRKLEALAWHRTQYPIVPSMLPPGLLQKMLGTEFFRRAASGRANREVNRRSGASGYQRTSRRPRPRLSPLTPS